MKTIEYRTLDDIKKTWGEGPWLTEPDKVQWLDEVTGLPCLIRRAHPELGFLCGYVGVPNTHPAYGKHYGQVNASVHGGLTFASRCNPDGDEETSICHVVEPGEDDDVWWLGFDCGHAWDVAPGTRHILASIGRAPSTSDDDVYRTFDYVKAEVLSLARQLKDGVSIEEEAA